MSARLLSLAALVALAGCAPMAGTTPPRVGSTLYSVDQQGSARLCTVTAPAEPTDGATAEAKMTLGNDGGWCAIPVSRAGPQPYAAGLLTKRPQHGNVTIHTVGDVTRLDYKPDTGFSGADSFGLRLLPGNATVQVAVTVQPTEPVTAPIVAPTPPAAARPVPNPRRPARP